MIFITLGSQKFQFNRLLQEIDRLIENNLIDDEVFAQTGYSDYIPKHYKYKQFLDREEFAKLQESCDIEITHGGTGAIIGALRKGKKVIAVPRLAKYGEHVDDHQLQIVKEFKEMGIICSCHDTENLEAAIQTVYSTEYKKYESNTHSIINSIESFIKDMI